RSRRRARRRRKKMNPDLTANQFRETMKSSKEPKRQRADGKLFLLVALTFAFAFTNQAANTGRLFASPEEAVASLRLATASADTNALRAILGSAAEELQNPDRVQSTNELKTFSSALMQTNRLVHVSDTFVLLELGEDLWPFPVPIVEKDGGWFFDTDAG